MYSRCISRLLTFGVSPMCVKIEVCTKPTYFVYIRNIEQLPWRSEQCTIMNCCKTLFCVYYSRCISMMLAFEVSPMCVKIEVCTEPTYFVYMRNIEQLPLWSKQWTIMKCSKTLLCVYYSRSIYVLLTFAISPFC